jgi:hypothetical protein
MGAPRFRVSNYPKATGFAGGFFTWTPGFGQLGNYVVVFIVTDDGFPSLSDSEEVTITVCDDNDKDGVSNEEEIGCPNEGDGNNDGTPDSKQENVISDL